MIRTTEYHDFSEKDNESAETQISNQANKTGRGAQLKFPARLHGTLESLEKGGRTDIVCWQPHGRAFKVHDKKRFESEILPAFFIHQKDMTSFQRQLNFYGFMRLAGPGPDQFAYCAFSYWVIELFHSPMILILTLVSVSFFRP